MSISIIYHTTIFLRTAAKRSKRDCGSLAFRRLPINVRDLAPVKRSQRAPQLVLRIAAADSGEQAGVALTTRWKFVPTAVDTEVMRGINDFVVQQC